MSDRAAADFPDKIRCQETGVIPTTLRDHVERDGRNIGKAIPKKSNAGIASAGFDMKTPEAPKDAATLIPEKTHVDPALVAKAAWRPGIKGHDARAFEALEQAANVSIDEVQVKAQKNARPMPKGEEKKKRVDNTVIQIQSAKGNYTHDCGSIS
jgi:hypothetical protein